MQTGRATRYAPYEPCWPAWELGRRDGAGIVEDQGGGIATGQRRSRLVLDHFANRSDRGRVKKTKTLERLSKNLGGTPMPPAWENQGAARFLWDSGRLLLVDLLRGGERD